MLLGVKMCVCVCVCVCVCKRVYVSKKKYFIHMKSLSLYAGS